MQTFGEEEAIAEWKFIGLIVYLPSQCVAILMLARNQKWYMKTTNPVETDNEYKGVFVLSVGC